VSQEDKTLPTIKVRKNALKGALRATIDGYTMIPVYNYLNQDINDDVNWQGCQYVADDRKGKYSNEFSFLSVSPYILEVMREPIARAFNLTPAQEKNLLYTEFYTYSDVLISENFEGDPKRNNFSA
jgi:hypothetical protein